MSNFAIIENGVVVDAIVAASQEIASEVTGKTTVLIPEDSLAGVGWGYDGSSFVDPNAEVAVIMDANGEVIPVGQPIPAAGSDPAVIDENGDPINP
jgi:hypothetical protein